MSPRGPVVPRLQAAAMPPFTGPYHQRPVSPQRAEAGLSPAPSPRDPHAATLPVPSALDDIKEPEGEVVNSVVCVHSSRVHILCVCVSLRVYVCMCVCLRFLGMYVLLMGLSAFLAPVI